MACDTTAVRRPETVNCQALYQTEPRLETVAVVFRANSCLANLTHSSHDCDIMTLGILNKVGVDPRPPGAKTGTVLMRGRKSFECLNPCRCRLLPTRGACSSAVRAADS